MYIDQIKNRFYQLKYKIEKTAGKFFSRWGLKLKKATENNLEKAQVVYGDFKQAAKKRNKLER